MEGFRRCRPMIRFLHLVVLLCMALLSGLRISSATDVLIRNLSKTHGDDYGRLGFSHVTIAGALHHGMKEVEIWLQTFAPGSGTPVHRHDCEEVFVVLKGKGTLYIAPPTDSLYPGTPDCFSFHVNTTFTVPVNAVHQIKNTNENEDFQVLVIISRPPVKVFAYENWLTPHDLATSMFPMPWDADLTISEQGQCEDSGNVMPY